MIKLAGIISKGNLELAWRRITTGRNLQHKNFFRHLYSGYELGLNNNIDLLHQKLAGNWQPTPPIRIHLPKVSGLLRPITLLSVEDQIILQAIANKLADNLRQRRRRVELKQVFSNCLERDPSSIFFLQDWRRTYHDFQLQLQQHLHSGYTWIAHFDLAAFYETISHRALRSLISPLGGDPQTWTRINHWLRIWSAGKDGVKVDHGIPQGPIASDLIADAFLLPVDEAMRRGRIKYIRYVDDIRVLARTEKEARQAAIVLELECRKWSLIPQSSKFIVKRAVSLQDALGTLPSIVESATPGEDDPELAPEDAERIMREALSGRPPKVIDKTRLRYVLYRASPRTKLLRRCLDLLPRHPEHIDAFMAYLNKYSHSSFIMERMRLLLREGVLYDYVEGQLWQLVAAIGKPSDLRRLVKIFKNRSRSNKRSMPLESGLLAFGSACVRVDTYPRRLIKARILKSTAHLQSLVIPFLDEQEFRKNGLIGKLLGSPHPEPGLAIATRLAERNLTHRSFSLRASQLAPQVRNALYGIGIISSAPATKFDQIGDILRTRFHIDYWGKWRVVFGTEFAHGLSLLLSSETKYESDPSGWLSSQDSFNDALFKALQLTMARLVLPGAQPVSNKYGELIDYGSLLDPSKTFSATYPSIATPLREAHNRRNQLPSSHPYEKKTAKQTTFLKTSERNRLNRRLAGAYREVTALLDSHI